MAVCPLIELLYSRKQMPSFGPFFTLKKATATTRSTTTTTAFRWRSVVTHAPCDGDHDSDRWFSRLMMAEGQQRDPTMALKHK